MGKKKHDTIIFVLRALFKKVLYRFRVAGCSSGHPAYSCFHLLTYMTLNLGSEDNIVSTIWPLELIFCLLLKSQKDWQKMFAYFIGAFQKNFLFFVNVFYAVMLKFIMPEYYGCFCRKSDKYLKTMSIIFLEIYVENTEMWVKF